MKTRKVITLTPEEYNALDFIIAQGWEKLDLTGAGGYQPHTQRRAILKFQRAATVSTPTRGKISVFRRGLALLLCLGIYLLLASCSKEPLPEPGTPGLRGTAAPPFEITIGIEADQATGLAIYYPDPDDWAKKITPGDWQGVVYGYPGDTVIVAAYFHESITLYIDTLRVHYGPGDLSALWYIITPQSGGAK